MIDKFFCQKQPVTCRLTRLEDLNAVVSSLPSYPPDALVVYHGAEPY